MFSRRFAGYWLPPIIWMALIFTASTDIGSSQNTSRIIAPLLRWLIPGVSETTVHRVTVFVRKGAHTSEYAILALLFWRARQSRHLPAPPRWSWSEFAICLFWVALYASSDELHQLFVSSRMASIVDVGIDTFGGTLGLLGLWACGRVSKKW